MTRINEAWEIGIHYPHGGVEHYIVNGSFPLAHLEAVKSRMWPSCLITLHRPGVTTEQCQGCGGYHRTQVRDDNGEWTTTFECKRCIEGEEWYHVSGERKSYIWPSLAKRLNLVPSWT